MSSRSRLAPHHRLLRGQALGMQLRARHRHRALKKRPRVSNHRLGKGRRFLRRRGDLQTQWDSATARMYRRRYQALDLAPFLSHSAEMHLHQYLLDLDPTWRRCKLLNLSLVMRMSPRLPRSQLPASTAATTLVQTITLLASHANPFPLQTLGGLQTNLLHRSHRTQTKLARFSLGYITISHMTLLPSSAITSSRRHPSLLCSLDLQSVRVTLLSLQLWP